MDHDLKLTSKDIHELCFDPILAKELVSNPIFGFFTFTKIAPKIPNEAKQNPQISLWLLENPDVFSNVFSENDWYDLITNSAYDQFWVNLLFISNSRIFEYINNYLKEINIELKT